MKSFWDDPQFRERMEQWIEEHLSDSEFMQKLKRDVAHIPRRIKLPQITEYSKDPLDAELLIEDILDADLVG